MRVNMAWGAGYQVKVYAEDNNTVISTHAGNQPFDEDVSNYNAVFVGGVTNSAQGDITFAFTS